MDTGPPFGLGKTDHVSDAAPAGSAEMTTVPRAVTSIATTTSGSPPAAKRTLVETDAREEFMCHPQDPVVAAAR
jgi:hypothetical protein